MSDIKLTYFDAKGRAEISRLILSYSGVKFTNERLSGEQFGAIKSSLPWGQIPVLNYKGQVMCQSLSIARFLAAEFGLAGKNNLESAQVDEIVDAVKSSKCYD
jgi:glutathione S-transferase